MQSESTLVSVIIPFLNEEEALPSLINELNSYFSKFHGKVEVIFVDDGSSDRSVEILSNEKHQSYSCKLIKLSKNFGSHAALRAGILHAAGSYITFMYADLQDPLELVQKMYEKIKAANCDVVWGNRENTSSGIDGIFSRIYAALMKRYAISNFPRNGFDIVLFNEKVKRELNENIEANSSIFLQILSLGFRHEYISYNKTERKAGKSKWTFSKKIKLAIDSLVAFSYAPIRFVTITGFLLFVAGVLWSGYVLTRKILYSDLEPGWPTLISVLMIGFGITNVSLGIIAEYLWRTLDSSRKRKVFIIDKIEKLNHE